MAREYKIFSWKGALYRISSSHFDLITREVVEQRRMLEEYINRHAEFLTALEPVSLLRSPPAIVKTMHEASVKTGIGPMAAVAGAMAEFASAAALESGADEVIVENGGDIYCCSPRHVTVALHSGTEEIADTLALDISPEQMPLSVCSSSSYMGHSLSFGRCNLATAVSTQAALADAAATLACNLVRDESDIPRVLDQVTAIDGISGLILVKNDKIGIAGDLPKIVRQTDPKAGEKITGLAESEFGDYGNSAR